MKLRFAPVCVLLAAGLLLTGCGLENLGARRQLREAKSLIAKVYARYPAENKAERTTAEWVARLDTDRCALYFWDDSLLSADDLCEPTFQVGLPERVSATKYSIPRLKVRAEYLRGMTTVEVAQALMRYSSLVADYYDDRPLGSTEGSVAVAFWEKAMQVPEYAAQQPNPKP